MNLETLDAITWSIGTVLSIILKTYNHKIVDAILLFVLLILSTVLNNINNRPTFRQGAGNGIICGCLAIPSALAALESNLFQISITISISTVLLFIITKSLTPTTDLKVCPWAPLIVTYGSSLLYQWEIKYLLQCFLAVSLSLFVLTVLIRFAPNSFTIGEFIFVSSLVSLPIPSAMNSTGITKFSSVFIIFGVICIALALCVKRPIIVFVVLVPIIITLKDIPEVISYIIQFNHLLLVGYCGIVCVIFILISMFWKGLKHFPQIIQRKFFHLMALLVFVPPVLINPSFLKLCISGAIFVFLFIESLRVTKFPFISSIINNYVADFIDERDGGELVLTHLFLLLGLGLPVLLADIDSPGSIRVKICGISVLAIGDAAASVIGVNFGKHKWPGSKKSYEGTVGAFVGTWLCMFIIQLFAKIEFSLLDLLSLAFPSLIAALDEAFTSQIDNLTLPFVMIPWICFCSVFIH
ncbi:dolichol kinase-like [Histomonas meleagridis]|uniref:dolichol kinase-like n=1 Tax=Histomonas meleagridis TaxID=135588 RepID=UPI00355A9023|nr:dolichol kinase-like [Histomonas meleagridis]KAH0799217.1 dolichol kinase-like [Histomonas meleagridis]